jgi:hypothetical protein
MENAIKYRSFGLYHLYFDVQRQASFSSNTPRSMALMGTR